MSDAAGHAYLVVPDDGPGHGVLVLHSWWGLTPAVKAVVELNPGQSVTAEELIALCKEKLGSVMAPKTVDFIPALPRSTVGKVLKKDLRESYWQDTERKL